MTDTGMPDGTTVGRVALRVTDLDRVVGFYRDVIGLDLLDEGAGRATLGAGGASLLELIGDPDAPARGAAETGLYHVAVRVPSRAALADALARIEDRWTLDGASDHLVSEALYLADPEDNGVEVYCDRPRASWPETEDGRVGMETVGLDLADLRGCGPGAPGVPPETTVGHVHLEVSSLPATRSFYAGALGLRVRQRYGDSALFLAAGDYHHHVGANVWNHRTEPPTGRGLAWFELAVPAAEFPSVRERLHDHGVDVADRDDGVALTDPDGIAVRLRPA
ncbi:MAG: VOC family protein [Haloferacaceae archaeon]